MSRRDTSLALVIVAVWGVNFVFIRYALDSYPPIFLAGLRFAISAVPVLWVARPRDVPVRWILIIGSTTGIVQFGALFLGMQHGLSPGLASLLLQVHTGLTVVLAAVLLRERPSRLQVAGLLVALAGLGLIAAFRGGSVSLVGFALVLLAALAWAAGNVATRLVRPSQPFALIVWVSLVPPVPMLALSLIAEGPGRLTGIADTIEPIGVIAVLYIGVISTLIGYVLWSALLERNAAASVVPFALLIPIVGMTAAAVVFGEHYSAGQIAGAATIIAGVALASGAVGRRRLGAAVPEPRSTASRGSGIR